MIKIPLNRDTLKSRISIIEESLKSLERFQGKTFEEFKKNPDHYRIAYFDIQRALEAVMDIASHILSRIPGTRPTSYKDLAIFLGKNKIVPMEFAENTLLLMAGYRNRMVHFYAEITNLELYTLIQERLKDFEEFCGYITHLLNDPSSFGLTIE